MFIRHLTWLVAALTTLPALALESLTDDGLAEATGQAGVTFVSSPLALSAANMFWHDTDGSAAYVSAARFNLKAFSQILTGLSVDLDVASTGNLAASRTGLFIRAGFTDLDMSASPGVESATGANHRSFGTFALNDLALSNAVFLILPKGNSAAGGTGNSGLTLAYANIPSLSGSMSFTDTNATGSSISQTFTVTGLDFSNTTIDVASASAPDGDGQGIKVKIPSTALNNIGVNISSLAIGGTTAGSLNLTGFNAGNTELTLRGR